MSVCVIEREGDRYNERVKMERQCKRERERREREREMGRGGQLDRDMEERDKQRGRGTGKSDRKGTIFWPLILEMEMCGHIICACMFMHEM